MFELYQGLSCITRKLETHVMGLAVLIRECIFKDHGDLFA